MRKRFNSDADGASLQATYIELVRCRQAHASAEARWREQASRLLTGKPAALWRRLDHLARRKQDFGRQLRRKSRGYAARLNGGA
jgi:hypothetical protein